MPRVPAYCPPNFVGHYTVNPGDTMYSIANMFRINLRDLVRANPHITNPNLIEPGDVLCVPGQVPFPCCVTLTPVQPSELGVAGVALVYTSLVGTTAVSVMAVLGPLPSGYDIWVAEVEIPNVDTGRHQIYPTPQTPPTFSGTIFFPTAATINPGTIVKVYPSKSSTNTRGPVKLQGTLTTCGT